MKYFTMLTRLKYDLIHKLVTPSPDLCRSVGKVSQRFNKLVHTRSLWIKVHIDLSHLTLAVGSYLHEGTRSLSIIMTPDYLCQGADIMKALERKCPELIKLTLIHPCYSLRFTPATKMNNVWDDGEIENWTFLTETTRTGCHLC
jgi:hypothetical protein